MATIKSYGTLKGSVQFAQATLSGRVQLAESTKKELYTGDYSVTPSTRSDIVLDTAGKTMTEDLTVTKVPYLEVSNLYGGKTITIGE